MHPTEFFTNAENHLNQGKPFVLYRKPGEFGQTVFTVRGVFQHDPHLYKVTDFTEQGFVMAPFDLNGSDSILFPKDKSECIETKIDLADLKWTPTKNLLKEEDLEGKNFHLELVKKGIRAIKSAKMDKVVVSRRMTVSAQSNPLTAFKRLLKKYPTAFVSCWYHPKIGLWLGATPESLLKTSGNRLSTVALAGTKSALESPEPQWTQKEIEEQQYVTRFIEETLVDKVKHLEIDEIQNVRAGNLWHLQNPIRAEIDSHKNLKEILEGLHPTPAVCGMPKDISKQFILEEEGYDREFYAGFLGELNMDSFDRSAKSKTDLFVNLRCMQQLKNTIQIYAGGGIVKDSNPESEWQEIINKSRTILDVL